MNLTSSTAASYPNGCRKFRAVALCQLLQVAVQQLTKSHGSKHPAPIWIRSCSNTRQIYVVLCCIVLYSTVLYCMALCCIVLYCIVLYCICLQSSKVGYTVASACVHVLCVWVMYLIAVEEEVVNATLCPSPLSRLRSLFKWTPRKKPAAVSPKPARASLIVGWVIQMLISCAT